MRPVSTDRTALRAGCAAALIAFLWSGATAAQEREPSQGGLHRAREQLRDLRYEDALATLSRTLAAGTSGPETTVQIYLLLGEVRASLGQDAEAERAFQRALSIDPAVELRPGLSPKIAGPFRKARRAQRGAVPLAIAHRIVFEDPLAIAVLVQSNPLDMVVGARIVYWGEGGGSSGSVSAMAERNQNRIDVELPRGVSHFTVAGIDEHGNRLVEIGSEEHPLSLDIDSGGKLPAAREAGASAPATASEREPPDGAAGPETALAAGVSKAGDSGAASGTPFYASWVLWGGIALGLGGVGTWAGLSANSAVDELDVIRASEYEFEYSHAKEVADRAEQRSLIANVCFAAAGVSATAAAILYFHGRKHNREQPAALAPLVGQGQLGVAASLRF